MVRKEKFLNFNNLKINCRYWKSFRFIFNIIVLYQKSGVFYLKYKKFVQDITVNLKYLIN